jgi:hypothetical protein
MQKENPLFRVGFHCLLFSALATQEAGHHAAEKAE